MPAWTRSSLLVVPAELHSEQAGRTINVCHAQAMLHVRSLVQLEQEASSDGLLSQMVYDYYSSGADCETTLRDNRQSYSRFKIIPRMMRDVSHVDMVISLLGTRVSAIGLTP
jgi:(S)-2-hydroxy-acid oxidase